MSLETQLEAIFNFTPQDLDDNQQGKLSAGQQRRLLRQLLPPRTLNLLMIMGIIVVVAIIFPIALWNKFSDSMRLVVIFTFLLVSISLLTATDKNAGNNNGLRLDLRAKRVNVVVGQPFFKSPKRVERVTYYEILVSDWNLFLTKQQYEQFQALVDVHPKQDYALFFLPHSKKVVAVCPISLDAGDFFVEA